MSPLIYGTRLHPEALDTMEGPLGYLQTQTGGVIEVWCEDELGLKRWGRKIQWPEEAMSVTTVAIDLAQSMGCNPIILAGCGSRLYWPFSLRRWSSRSSKS